MIRVGVVFMGTVYCMKNCMQYAHMQFIALYCMQYAVYCTTQYKKHDVLHTAPPLQMITRYHRVESQPYARYYRGVTGRQNYRASPGLSHN